MEAEYVIASKATKEVILLQKFLMRFYNNGWWHNLKNQETTKRISVENLGLFRSNALNLIGYMHLFLGPLDLTQQKIMALKTIIK